MKFVADRPFADPDDAVNHSAKHNHFGLWRLR